MSFRCKHEHQCLQLPGENSAENKMTLQPSSGKEGATGVLIPTCKHSQHTPEHVRRVSHPLKFTHVPTCRTTPSPPATCLQDVTDMP